MSRVLTIIISFIVVALSVSATQCAWLVLLIVDCLLVFGISTERLRARPIEGAYVPAGTQRLLRRYAFFYRSPGDAHGFAQAAATFAFVGIVVALAGLLQGFWAGFVLGSLHYVLMTNLARDAEPVGCLHALADSSAGVDVFGDTAE